MLKTADRPTKDKPVEKTARKAEAKKDGRDGLKAAQQACVAKGGSLKLQKNGDVQYLDDYACEKK